MCLFIERAFLLFLKTEYLKVVQVLCKYLLLFLPKFIWRNSSIVEEAVVDPLHSSLIHVSDTWFSIVDIVPGICSWHVAFRGDEAEK